MTVFIMDNDKRLGEAAKGCIAVHTICLCATYQLGMLKAWQVRVARFRTR